MHGDHLLPAMLGKGPIIAKLARFNRRADLDIDRIAPTHGPGLITDDQISAVQGNRNHIDPGAPG